MTKTIANHKKLFATLLAVLMLVGLLPVTVFAADPAFSVTSATGKAGQEVKVQLKIENNTGIVAAWPTIKYDSAVLELTKVEKKDFLGETVTDPNKTDDPKKAIFFPGDLKKNPVTIGWDDSTNPNNTKNGVFAELTFKIKDGAPAGDTAITVDYDADGVFDYDLKSVTFAKKNGKITVADAGTPLTYTVNIDNKTSGAATVTGIVDGNKYSGSTTFTVSCANACAVAYTTDGGTTYTRLTAVADGGKYKFTVDVTQDMTIAVVKKGDTNLNGDVATQDATIANAANLSKRTLTALQKLAADVNGDGDLKTQDVTRLKAFLLNKTTLTWDT